MTLLRIITRNGDYVLDTAAKTICGVTTSTVTNRKGFQFDTTTPIELSSWEEPEPGLPFVGDLLHGTMNFVSSTVQSVEEIQSASFRVVDKHPR